MQTLHIQTGLLTFFPDKTVLSTSIAWKKGLHYYQIVSNGLKFLTETVTVDVPPFHLTSNVLENVKAVTPTDPAFHLKVVKLISKLEDVNQKCEKINYPKTGIDILDFWFDISVKGCSAYYLLELTSANNRFCRINTAVYCIRATRWVAERARLIDEALHTLIKQCDIQERRK